MAEDYSTSVQSFFRQSGSYEFINLWWLSLYSPLTNNPLLLRMCVTSLLKTVGKEEIARNEQFLLFPQCFLPFWRTFCHFHLIWNYHLQSLSVWKYLKFVFGKGIIHQGDARCMKFLLSECCSFVLSGCTCVSSKDSGNPRGTMVKCGVSSLIGSPWRFRGSILG